LAGIIDVCTSFGLDRTQRVEWGLEDLLAVLAGHQVEQALTMSLRGVYYDANSGNDETWEACRQHEVLQPVATVNPQRYFDCAEEIERRVEQGFKALRFFPDTQGWSVEGLNFIKLCERVADLGGRLMLPGAGAGQPTRIAKLLADLALPVLLVGVGYGDMGELLAVLAEYPKVYCDAHMMDTPGALETLMQMGGEGKVMFGSNSPQRYFESPLLMAEHADLTEQQRRRYLRENALAFLGESGS
jgi:predicted TIM-barrel fold metal-dependent hydrolase